MNCERLLEKCGAECCGPCPFPRGLWERNMHRIVRPPLIARLDDQGHVHAVSAEGACVFNRPGDHRCNIYADRPEICRRYGDETDLFLTCPWQAADGRARCRGERRRIHCEQRKRQRKFLKGVGCRM